MLKRRMSVAAGLTEGLLSETNIICLMASRNAFCHFFFTFSRFFTIAGWNQQMLSTKCHLPFAVPTTKVRVWLHIAHLKMYYINFMMSYHRVIPKLWWLNETIHTLLLKFTNFPFFLLFDISFWLSHTYFYQFTVQEYCSNVHFINF